MILCSHILASISLGYNEHRDRKMSISSVPPNLGPEMPDSEASLRLAHRNHPQFGGPRASGPQVPTRNCHRDENLQTLHRWQLLLQLGFPGNKQITRNIHNLRHTYVDGPVGGCSVHWLKLKYQMARTPRKLITID